MNVLDKLLAPYIPEKPVFLIARFALALMFIESAIDKIMRWDFFMDEINRLGIPFSAFSLAAATLIEIMGSLALLTGFAVIPSLVALSFYTIFVNFFYFDFWNKEAMDAIMARKEFLKNIAVAGGLMTTLLYFSKKELKIMRSE